MNTDLTIWIPTKNRPEFLERVLCYYSKTEFSGVVFVGDSSEGEALERNRESIENYGQSLQVYYQHFPGLGQGQVSASLVPEIETEYSTFLSDDDLIVTEAVKPVIERLNSDAQLSGMNGKALSFNVLNDNAWGIVSNVHWYPLANLAQPTPSERVAEYFSSVKNTNMCIQRTSVQKTVFGEVKRLSHLHSNVIFEELLGAVVSSIRGRIETYPELFLCRQSHSSQFFGSIDLFDWLTDRDWQASFKLLEKTFVYEMRKASEMTETQAREYFKTLFRPYLSNLVGGLEHRHQALSLKRKSHQNQINGRMQALEYITRRAGRTASALLRIFRGMALGPPQGQVMRAYEEPTFAGIARLIEGRSGEASPNV